jgi:hypothetical protein
VLSFLEVSVRLGYWSRKTADGVAESVREGYGLRRFGVGSWDDASTALRED